MSKLEKPLSYSASLERDDIAPATDWTEKRWYVFKVQPQKEFVARRLLRNLGLDAFCPVEEKTRRRASRHASSSLIRRKGVASAITQQSKQLYALRMQAFDSSQAC